MSIQSELDRISGAKSDIITSIEGKGVNVPEGAKIDDLATYVNAIVPASDIPAAGISLGLVKSGGDVSISDGVITVNDDSHNHVISNVDGLQTALDGKLAKTTYEATAELPCGSNGKVCIGRFGAYDTNITIELNSTTNNTYHATIIIHSQNVVANGTGGTVGCYVYGDADNHITPLLSVFRPYGSASRQIEVYANLPGWSKNLVHIQAVALSTGGMTDVLTSVTEVPTAIDGKIKVTPVNVLTTNFASKAEITEAKTYTDNKVAALVNSSPAALDTLNELATALGNDPNFATTVATQIGRKADQTDVDQLYDMIAEKANTSSLSKVATSGSYNDLSNKPTIPTVNNATLTIQKNGSNVATFTANSSTNQTANITVPTKVSELTNDSGFKTTDNNTTYSLSKSGSTITLTGSDGSTSSVTDSNSTSYLPLSGGSMNSDATIKLTTYGTRHLTLSGNAISADMSNETGGWAGNFASVKAPGGVTTTMLGWYGGTSGLTHIFMGGTYSDPALKMTPAGQFTFKSAPKVGTSNVALESSLSNYVTTAKLEEVLGSYVNDIDALLGG